MGVKNLWDILESCKKTLPLHHLQYVSTFFCLICFSRKPNRPQLLSFHFLYVFSFELGVRNKRVCIDLSCWMVQLQNASKSPFCMKEKVYLKGLFHRLRALIALNCSLIFVTGIYMPLFLFLFQFFSCFPEFPSIMFFIFLDSVMY